MTTSFQSTSNNCKPPHKPFNLEKALAGELLIDLENNEKCFLLISKAKNCYILEYEEYENDECNFEYVDLNNDLSSSYGMWVEPTEPVLLADKIEELKARLCFELICCFICEPQELGFASYAEMARSLDKLEELYQKHANEIDVDNDDLNTYPYQIIERYEVYSLSDAFADVEDSVSYIVDELLKTLKQ